MKRFFRIEADIWAVGDLSFLEKGLLQHIKDLIINLKDHSPTAEYLSRIFGVSKSTIRRRSASLETKGYIRIRHITENKRTRWYFEVTQNEHPKETEVAQNEHPRLPKMKLRVTQNERPINKTPVNKELNNNTPPLPPKVKEVPTAAVPAVKDEENSLYHSVKDAFLSKVGTFTSWPKEGAAIKGLIKKATARSPDDPGGFLKELIGAYYKIRKEDKFFGKQPFLPSALNAAGIFDRVMVSFETEEEEIPEEIRHLYEGVKI